MSVCSRPGWLGKGESCMKRDSSIDQGVRHGDNGGCWSNYTMTLHYTTVKITRGIFTLRSFEARISLILGFRDKIF